MWSSTIFAATALATFLKGVSSAPSPSTDEAPNGIAGYNIVDVSWDLPVKLDDPTSEIVTVTGTIEEAIAQMEAAYPGWNETFQAGIPTDPMPTGDDTSFVSAGTADEQPESINCKVDYDGARTSKIWDGICYLRRLNTDPPKNGPGPGNCGRVSCSWKSAIYWCNDNLEEKELTWKQIGDGANSVLHGGCITGRSTYQRVKGQAFFKDNWNVLVRGDDC